MDLQIADRAALVCGSSSGLGLAIATALAAEGCRVALNGRNPDRLQRAVDRLRSQTDAEVRGFQADVSVPSDAGDLVARVGAAFGSVDILLCNAGGPPATTFAQADATVWLRALELNLLSTIQLCRAAVPGMRERGWGRVLCLTSIAAKQPLGDLILSTTGRAGVLGFAKALADEVAADGVTVNVLCPGYMRTERSVELMEHRAAAGGESVDTVVERLGAAIPMRRMGDPAELAAVAAFLASERASYLTGTAIQVDGGFIRSII
jgi:3-oxoacyl-[acyl-carrier protein] reductase